MTTVFINKICLSGIDLDAPMFMAFYQTVISLIIITILRNTTSLFDIKSEITYTSPFEWTTFKKVI